MESDRTDHLKYLIGATNPEKEKNTQWSNKNSYPASIVYQEQIFDQTKPVNDSNKLKEKIK